MNTQIDYLYRDACNYKTYKQIIISGKLTFEQLLPTLRDKTFFIPSKVGLKDLQPLEWTEDDHIWHELVRLSYTKIEPTIEISARQLLKLFFEAFEKDWYEYEGEPGEWFFGRE